MICNDAYDTIMINKSQAICGFSQICEIKRCDFHPIDPEVHHEDVLFALLSQFLSAVNVTLDVFHQMPSKTYHIH